MICYFDNNYKKQYYCSFSIEDESIIVEVDYNVEDEIEATNGVKLFGPNTNYRQRDILIDTQNGELYYLLKNANVTGISISNNYVKSKFRSFVFFSSKNINELILLKKTPKVSKIIIYSDSLAGSIRKTGVLRKYEKGKFIIELSNAPAFETADINKNNIKSISLVDVNSYKRDIESNSVIIKKDDCIVINLVKRINYTEIYQNVYELFIYLQLYSYNHFVIDKTKVEIDKLYYGFQQKLNYQFKRVPYIDNSVKDDLISFLKKCYLQIPYNSGSIEKRNIANIVINSSRNLEDHFMILYRFIESFYKKQDIKEIKKTFISYSIKNNYNEANSLSDDEIEDKAAQITSLRNYYVHSGYHLKNNSLHIKFQRIGKKANPKNYTKKDIDADYIYDLASILYDISMNIIFKELLVYQNYNYNHF